MQMQFCFRNFFNIRDYIHTLIFLKRESKVGIKILESEEVSKIIFDENVSEKHFLVSFSIH